jgi:hypothetical protein
MEWALVVAALFCGDDFLTKQNDEFYRHALSYHSQFYRTMGVMQEREDHRYFRWGERLWDDVKVMEDRIRITKPDTPDYYESNRLPQMGELLEWRNDYWSYCAYLEKLYPDVDPIRKDEIKRSLREAAWLYGMVDIMVDIRSSWGDHRGPRWGLEKLRDYVGKEVYDAADWPYHLPLDSLHLPWRKPDLLNEP